MAKQKTKAVHRFSKSGIFLVIILCSLILLSSAASAATATYRWIPSSGATVATGISTNWGACDARPTTFVTTLLTDASTSGCASDRHGSAALDPATDIFFNTAYTQNTNIQGISYFGRLRDSSTGGGTFTFRLIYVYPNGTKVVLPGSGSQAVTSGQSADFNVSLTGISGTVPSGAKLGLRISKSGSSTSLRAYVGDTASVASTPSGVFSVTETPAGGGAQTYNLSGYITNKSSGVPLNGATVQTNTSLSTTTNSQGYYIFSGLSNGSYLINATLTGYAVNSTTTSISGANKTNVNISLSPIPTYILSGYVTNSSNGAAISGATVTTNTSLMTTTNGAGYYSFTVGNGTYIITASKTGYSNNSRTNTVSDAAVNNANISLTLIPPSPSGKIFVATNRYVILDDPLTSGKTAQTAAGFALPSGTSWTPNSWSSAQTTIKGYALVLDSNGKPITNTPVIFKVRNWDSSDQTTSSAINTDANGIASYSLDLNAKNYYGNWYVDANATAISKNDSTGFIYNWWGCNAGGCRNHANNPPNAASSTLQNSPYTLGREGTTSRSDHRSGGDTNCVGCHRSYGGTGGGNTFSGQPFRTADVHVTDTCSTCHATTITQHQTNANIPSCSGCHPWSNLSIEYTMSSGTTPLSNYSGNVAATGHNPNNTISCIICHGPMHNITKPDESLRLTRNSIVEDSQCLTCHTTYNKHKGGVGCTLCHSQDVHAIKVLSQSAGYVNKGNTYQGNCTNCHQNASFLNALKLAPKAGSYSGPNAPQVQKPLNHSNDLLAGQKWNSYWTNGTSGTAQLSSCIYCHGSTQHSLSALGKPSLFKGNNVVNSTITTTTSWCASCHWQGYTSGTNSYMDMVNAFLPLLVPPEITGDPTYGAQGKPGFYNHSGFAMNDQNCKSCHGSLSTSPTITGLLHNVAKGTAGGVNCTSCHYAGSTSAPNVDIVNMGLGAHANLNNRSQYTGGNITNRKCWACHGTLNSNGFANESNQPVDSHNTSIYKNPRGCTSCHNNTQLNSNFSAPPVVEHMIGAPDVPTTGIQCSLCHNNSLTSITETDGFGLSLGGNAQNATTSHYLKDATTNLMTTTIHSNNCTWCHFTNTNNASWGTPVDPRINLSFHTGRVNVDCYNCHGGLTSSVKLHDSKLTAGAGCTNCHTQPPGGTIRYNMTGAHDLHAAEGYGDVPETGCDYCHSTEGRFESGHPNGDDNASVVVNASASITITNYQMIPASGNDDTCIGVSCHSTGLTPAASIGTAVWNTATAGSCTNCHSTEVSGIPPTGNHTKHYTGEGYSCADCHGTGADSASQTGHNNGTRDINFTNLSSGGSINATLTCSVYCHSPNTNDLQPKPTWNVSSVVCGNCHSLPPSTLQTGSSHPASNGSDCYTCHGAGANTGTQTGHIDGTITTSGMSCETCHSSYNAAVLSTKHNQSINPSAPNCTLCHTGYEPVSGHTTGNKGYTVNESNTCRNCHIDNVNGFKEAHTGSSDCTQCHFANTTQPFSLNASLYAHDHNLTVEHSYYEYTNDGGMPLAINGGTGVGMFPQYTCSLTCHATRNPEKVDKASSTWLNSSHADSRFGASDSKNNCALCKSPTNYDDTLKATNPNITEEDWDGIQCKVCHNLHNRSFSGITGNPVAFYNATASSYVNYSVYDKVSNNTDLCEKCHQPGGSHDSKFAGPHKTTSSLTCTSCHMNASFSRGMHDFQVKNTTSSVTGCEVCHDPVSHSFQFTVQHTDKVDCVACHDQTFTTANATGYSVSSDNYFGLWKETPTSVWTTAKKMSSSPGTWPLHNLSKSVNCDKCHGAESLYNGTIALDSGAFCEGCHTQPPSGTARYNMTGAHDLHASDGYGSVPEVSCDYCHATEGKNEPGHPNVDDDANVTTNASASIATYLKNTSSGNDDTCSGVSCHSSGLTPSAQVGTSVWNTATAGSCTNCHSTEVSGIPPTGNHTKHYTGEGYYCADCHGTGSDSASQVGHNNGTRDLSFTNLSYGGSINGTKACSVYCHSPNPTNDPKPKPVWNITNVSCGDCHSIPPTAFTTRNGVPHPSDTNCDGCHGTGAVTGEQSGHINGSIEASGSGCISCHSIDRNGYPGINLTLFTKHSNVNTTGGTGILTDDDCTTCHYDFNMTLMYDPVNDTPTKACTDCHIDGSYQAPIISNHRPPNISIIPGGAIGTKEYCSTCHINSINEFNFSVNASISHYGTTASLLKPTVNQTSMPRFGFMNPTDASTYNKECRNCHNPSNPDYGNATLITVSHTSKGTCNGCHVNASASDLHNSTLGMPETFQCKACHTTYADKYGAPNLIGTTMGLKSDTSCEGCHGGGGNNGLLDSLSKHNIDRNENGFTGISGRTGTVYLNSQITLTVTKGTVISVNSSINDTAGLASRVGGAEYYVDTDPGIGKGTPMDAVDGNYNAVNTNWENITGTIDTSALSSGTHTVYVRGMDIGKQWSAVKSATLTVLPAKGFINGTVTSAGSAIAGAIVSTTGTSTITDSNGNYSLMLDSGTYDVTVRKLPVYNDNTTTGIVVTTDNTTIQNFVLTLKPTGTITGTVRNA